MENYYNDFKNLCNAFFENKRQTNNATDKHLIYNNGNYILSNTNDSEVLVTIDQ